MSLDAGHPSGTLLCPQILECLKKKKVKGMGLE
jgi:hypothetical protein